MFAFHEHDLSNASTTVPFSGFSAAHVCTVYWQLLTWFPSACLLSLSLSLPLSLSLSFSLHQLANFPGFTSEHLTPLPHGLDTLEHLKLITRAQTRLAIKVIDLSRCESLVMLRGSYLQ